MLEKYLFQYCQKIVVLSHDEQKVLLCKRKTEVEFDGIYSFIGGKMETSDESIVAGMKREKDEEVGENFRLTLYPDYTINIYFKKKDGNFMILPHCLAVHVEGEIKLGDEYSDHKWVSIRNIDKFEPKIENIPEVIDKLLKVKSTLKSGKSVKI